VLIAAVAVATCVLAFGSGAAGASEQDCSGWNPPNALRLATGSPQQTQVGKPFQTNLQVMLVNTDGCPLTGTWAGVSVVFTAPPAGGASGVFATTDSNVADVGTDAGGTATAPTFTANGTPGNYTIQVASSYGAVTLYLTNTATGVAASIAPAGPAALAATVDSRYDQRLQAQLRDADGQPVASVGVDFVLGTGVTGAGAAFPVGGNQATVLTDANGLAISPRVIANGVSGRFSATASTDGVSSSVDYSLRNFAPRLRAGATSQTATVDHRFRRPLLLTARDSRGRPVEGVTVTFTLQQATGGPGATFQDGSTQASATTNIHGQATSPPLQANSTAGRFSATASANGSKKPISYMLRNAAGPAASITAGAANGESTSTGSRFPIRLAVTVADKDGNPLPGAIVAFAAPASGPSGSFSHSLSGREVTSRIVRVRANSEGIALAPVFIANARAGGYAVTARTGGRQTAFALVNTRR
jgi:protocatechuate 3,4-dioxygenase beta subunit